MKEEPKHRFTGIFIPLKVYLIEDINIFEKLFISLMLNFFEQEQQSYVVKISFILEVFNLKKSFLKKHLKSLEEKNYIKLTSLKENQDILVLKVLI